MKCSPQSPLVPASFVHPEAPQCNWHSGGLERPFRSEGGWPRLKLTSAPEGAPSKLRLSGDFDGGWQVAPPFRPFLAKGGISGSERLWALGMVEPVGMLRLRRH